MKSTPFLLAVLVPFAAAAGSADPQKVDEQKLQDAMPVTQIVGQDVRTRDGQELGEIESVAFNEDGTVAYYEIEPDMKIAAKEGTSQGEDEPGDDAATSMGGDDVASHDIVGGDREAVTAAGEDQTPVEGDAADDGDIVGSDIGYEGEGRTAARTNMGDDDTVWVTPDQVSLEGDNVVIEQGGLDEQQRSAGRPAAAIESDELVGMQVDLADEESFGEVEDVMISRQGDKAVALVVDNWDGVEKQRRALPVKLDSIDQEDNSIRYDMSRAELDQANFDLDQYEEQDDEAMDVDM